MPSRTHQNVKYFRTLRVWGIEWSRLSQLSPGQAGAQGASSNHAGSRTETPITQGLKLWFLVLAAGKHWRIGGGGETGSQNGGVYINATVLLFKNIDQNPGQGDTLQIRSMARGEISMGPRTGKRAWK